VNPPNDSEHDASVWPVPEPTQLQVQGPVPALLADVPAEQFQWVDEHTPSIRGAETTTCALPVPVP